MTIRSSLVALFSAIGLVSICQTYTEGFNDLSNLNDWYFLNNSEAPNLTWEQGNTLNITAHNGDPQTFLGVGYESSSSETPAIISNWAVSPSRTFNNGDILTFYSKRKEFTPVFPDRLEVRFSAEGNSIYTGFSPEDVGDFNSLLLSINPDLTANGYPDTWTQYTIVISGLPGPINGRIAFRYYVTEGGPNGSNSNYIGIDSFTYYSSLPESINDDCETAEILNHDSSCSPVSGSLIVASSSLPACDGTANNDVWYQFTANTNAASIEVAASPEMDAVVEIYAGNCTNLSSLTCINTSYDGGTEATTVSDLIIGNDYFIRVFDWHNWVPNTLDFTICLESFEQCSISPGINSTSEYEVCGTDSNGGCYAQQPEYQDVVCYESVYGSIWVENGLKDYDWYRFSINASGIFNFNINSEFPVTLEIFNIGNCNIPQLLQSQSFNSCEQGLFSGNVPEGTYALVVSATSNIPISCSDLNHYEVSFNLPLSDVSLNSDSDSLFFCEGTPFYLSSNQNEGDFLWFLNNELISTLDSALINSAGFAFLNYTNSNGCASNYSDTVTVVFNPTNDASFSYESDVICVGDAIIENNNDEEGVYIVESGLSIDLASGAINANESSLGSYIVIHETFGNCPDTAETLVTIGSYQDLLFQLPTDVICDTANNISLIAEPEGGVYSGAGVEQDMFFPSLSGIGTQTITYSYDNSGCISETSQNILVENCASLDEILLNSEVWPNPFHDALQIRTIPQTKYSLHTLHGKILAKGVTKQEYTTIHNLNQMNSGMYFLQLEEGQKVKNFSIWKQ
jgi:hypothetical protein